MAKKKATKTKKQESVLIPAGTMEFEELNVLEVPLAPLALDYPHEYLNDMGRKINEIITKLNAI